MTNRYRLRAVTTSPKRRDNAVKGKDYDFGIEYADGREACADAKCRLESTEVRADTIKNSLNKARTNNLAGQAWHHFRESASDMARTGRCAQGRRRCGRRISAANRTNCFGGRVRHICDRSGETEDDSPAAPFSRIPQCFASLR
jgi:hypothetical protein